VRASVIADSCRLLFNIPKSADYLPRDMFFAVFVNNNTHSDTQRVNYKISISGTWFEVNFRSVHSFTGDLILTKNPNHYKGQFGRASLIGPCHIRGLYLIKSSAYYIFS
jgi:hypothetical protein